MNSSIDNRTYPRVDHLLMTAFQHFDDSGDLLDGSLGRTLNISEGGIMLETTKPLPLLAMVNLSIALKEEILAISGEIVHLRKNDQGRIEIGIQFHDISDEDRRKINEFY